NRAGRIAEIVGGSRGEPAPPVVSWPCGGRGRTFESCRAHRARSGGPTGEPCSPRGQLALRRQRPHVRIVPGASLTSLSVGSVPSRAVVRTVGGRVRRG